MSSLMRFEYKIICTFKNTLAYFNTCVDVIYLEGSRYV
jgi:hypothetical protein